jgi:serine/threonine protein kinase
MHWQLNSYTPERLFVRVARSELFPDFFSLGTPQDPENPVDDGFYYHKDVCPLFKTFGHPKALSQGSYGMVIRYTLNRDARIITRLRRERSLDPRVLPDYVAIKLQQVNDSQDGEEEAHSELRVAYTIQQMASHWDEVRKKYPFNHVALYDAFQCEFNPNSTLGPMLAEKDKTKLTLAERHGVNQLQVMEFINAGTWEEALMVSKESMMRCTSEETTRNIFAQVLGHIRALGKASSFTHGDLAPKNIFFQQVPLTVQSSHLLYHEVGLDGRSLFVPLWSGGLPGVVCKVGDHSLSRISVVQRINEKEYAVAIPDKGGSYSHNPAADTERFAATYIRAVISALYAFSDGAEPSPRRLGEYITPRVAAVLLECFYGQTQESVGREEKRDYAAVMNLLRRLMAPRLDRLASGAINLSTISSACTRIYFSHARRWIYAPTGEGYLTIIERILTMELFYPLMTPPEGIDASSQILHMTDYNKVEYNVDLRTKANTS